MELLGAQGWRVESYSDYEAVVARERRPNHGLHLLLTFMTFFLWALVGIAQTRSSRRTRRVERRLVSVDAWGNWHVETLLVPTAPSPDLGGLAAGGRRGSR